jgi:hypothetical protein
MAQYSPYLTTVTSTTRNLSYTVTLYVGDSATRKAIMGASVTLDSSTPQLTDLHGKAVIGGVSQGWHWLAVTKPGYGPYTTTINVNWNTFSMVWLLPPTFTLSPISGVSGTRVDTSGSTYAGSTCTLSSSPSGLMSSRSCSISGGTLTGNFTVASGAYGGSYTVMVTTNAGETSTATFYVIVQPLTLTLNPISGTAGTKVNASGSGYVGTACVLYSSPGLFSTSKCSISGGTLTGNFTVASGAYGGTYMFYWVGVTTNASETAWASFTVPAPTLALNPISGTAGTKVNASGSGYVGTACVLWSSPPGLFSTSKCSISGGTLTGTFTVASATSPGTYIVRVTTNAGETVALTFTVLVS